MLSEQIEMLQYSVRYSKTHGGGLCIYVNSDWCRDAVLVSKYCSPSVEIVVVQCGPFYILHEFTAVFTLGVYIPPSAKDTNALTELYGPVSDLQCAHPDRLIIASTIQILRKFYTSFISVWILELAVYV